MHVLLVFLTTLLGQSIHISVKLFVKVFEISFFSFHRDRLSYVRLSAVTLVNFVIT